MVKVVHLGDNKEYWFFAKTPYEAMRKMQYYLNLKMKGEYTIHKTVSGNHLYICDGDETYSVRN